MKKLFIVLFISTLVISCNERIVQLPETTNKEITEILDVSPIYMFYDETKPEGIEFNRKNMISTTNWLVNIDKRLTLKQILPHLQYLQEKRHGDGMHKNESAKNYFSCSNPEIQNLAFLEFTDVNYFLNTKYQYFKDGNKPVLYGIIDINSLEKISLSLVEDGHDHMDHGYFNISDLNKKIMEFNTEYKLLTFLTFNSEITFQDYITVKSKLLKLDWEHIEILKDELIYN